MGRKGRKSMAAHNRERQKKKKLSELEMKTNALKEIFDLSDEERQQLVKETQSRRKEILAQQMENIMEIEKLVERERRAKMEVEEPEDVCANTIHWRNPSETGIF